jgi:hypothetical protein
VKATSYSKPVKEDEEPLTAVKRQRAILEERGTKGGTGQIIGKRVNGEGNGKASKPAGRRVPCALFLGTDNVQKEGQVRYLGPLELRLAVSPTCHGAGMGTERSFAALCRLIQFFADRERAS